MKYNRVYTQLEGTRVSTPTFTQIAHAPANRVQTTFIEILRNRKMRVGVSVGTVFTTPPPPTEVHDMCADLYDTQNRSTDYRRLFCNKTYSNRRVNVERANFITSLAEIGVQFKLTGLQRRYGQILCTQ
jgi:hypothetical protein